MQNPIGTRSIGWSIPYAYTKSLGQHISVGFTELRIQLDCIFPILTDIHKITKMRVCAYVHTYIRTYIYTRTYTWSMEFTIAGTNVDDRYFMFSYMLIKLAIRTHLYIAIPLMDLGCLKSLTTYFNTNRHGWETTVTVYCQLVCTLNLHAIPN